MRYPAYTFRVALYASSGSVDSCKRMAPLTGSMFGLVKRPSTHRLKSGLGVGQLYLGRFALWAGSRMFVMGVGRSAKLRDVKSRSRRFMNAPNLIFESSLDSGCVQSTLPPFAVSDWLAQKWRPLNA